MKLFFDLDGTLLDSRLRLYKLFHYLVPNSMLSFDEYWDLKRNKIGHEEILKVRFGYSIEAYEKFQSAWMEKIEKYEWIVLDQPFSGVKEYLVDLKKRHDLYVVTARQHKEVVFNQLKQTGLAGIFDDIFVTGQLTEKYDLIKCSVSLNENDWFIGDTGKDIQTGKQLGIKTAAVLSGFLSKEKLEAYFPDRIVNNVLELKF